MGFTNKQLREMAIAKAKAEQARERQVAERKAEAAKAARQSGDGAK